MEETYLSNEAMQAAREMLPAHCVEQLLAYFNQRTPVGHFLYAVLSNDLMGAFRCADAINIHHIRAYCEWLHNWPPGRPNGWGSTEAVDEWLRGE